MRTIQQRIIQTFQVKPTVNSNFEIRERVNFLKSYLRSVSAQGFVLGISGGQDSSLAGRLCQLAAQELREEGTEARFTAVRLPYRKQRDEEDAQQALRFIQPDGTVTVDVSPGTDSITKECEKLLPEPVTDFNKGNLKARVRMAAQYLIAGHGNHLVIGTDHAAEAVTGFFAKFGDGAADLLPLAGLNKRQGKKLLQTLGSPPILWEKKPTADLLDSRPGLLDETELGLSYDDIDDFLEGKDVPEHVAEAIESRFLATQHKRSLPVTPYDAWWQKTA